ncbi:rhomboid family intramembrane serine protease [Yoonia vestfoldensis]|uniref:Rhomboid family protein n=1 Tax=Yoonia vestfoldensis TaxID=245188 RepID=A0A1Y0EFD2_9RHOB|nr:rhomboid family intramembrane serine protease [Yoonia vestfoldensis]ARU02061.1 rhomboid family protein [Yoonia vestfoldensis]
MSDNMSEKPINDLSPVVIGLALLIIGAEAAFQLANAGLIGGPRGLGWRMEAVGRFGFSPAVLDRVLVQGDWSVDMLMRFVTYPFVNGEIVQTAFCAALTLALGKFTSEYFGGLKVLVIYLACAIIGAVAYGLLVDGNAPLLGGFTPVYGLIGAYTYVLWLRLGQAGENQLMAFRLIGFLLALQLGFGLIFGAGQSWIAELSGFVAGFVLAVPLAPGGWAMLLARMRQRS